jgi:hypothetical protein
MAAKATAEAKTVVSRKSLPVEPKVSEMISRRKFLTHEKQRISGKEKSYKKTCFSKNNK